MDRVNITCANCSGIGNQTQWKVVDYITGKLQKEETVCEACNGKGYTEYAMFSIEEANAILRHCGLITEN